MPEPLRGRDRQDRDDGATLPVAAAAADDTVVTGARRGRPPVLSHADILAAALRIGVADLSMVRVAVSLKVRHTALYRYFPSRDHLVNAVLDQLCEGLAWPETLTHNDWAHQLRAVFQSLRTLTLRHPGMAAELLIARRDSSALQRRITMLERDLAAVGLSAGDARALLDALLYCTLGSAATTTPGRSPADTGGEGGEASAVDAGTRWARQLDLIFAGVLPQAGAAAARVQVQSAVMNEGSVDSRSAPRHRFPGGTCAL
jgi:AcrR family transcriptional regulator